MNKKRLIIFSTVVTLIFVVSFVWQQSQQKTSPAKKTVTLSQPALPSPITTTQPSYQVASLNRSFPQELPLFSISPEPQTKTSASALSSSLGINSQPQAIPSSKGTMFLWSDGKKTVVASDGHSSVSYTSDAVETGSLSGPLEKYFAAADKVIAPLHNQNQVLQLTHTTPQYFKPGGGDANEVSSMSQATSVQVNYQYTIGGTPVYVGSSTHPSASVRLNSKGDVFSFTIMILPVLSATKDAISVVPYSTAVQNLIDGKGRLTDLVSDDLGDQPYFFDSPPQISNVQNVELAYYYSTGQKQLVPVYAFRGVGTIKNKKINTTTLVSAVK